MRPVFAAVITASLLCSSSAFAKCALTDINVKSVDAKFVKADCNSPVCTHLNGVAVIENKCATAVGVRLKLIAYDINNRPIAVNEGWPASIDNIAPGEYTFSLKHWMEYDPAIKSLKLEVTKVKKW